MIASINVHDLDGNPVDLMQKYSGKPLLLIIYNNDCLGCIGRAIPLAFYQDYNPQGKSKLPHETNTI